MHDALLRGNPCESVFIRGELEIFSVSSVRSLVENPLSGRARPLGAPQGKGKTLGRPSGPALPVLSDQESGNGTTRSASGTTSRVATVAP
jgi:hypothetical protein